MRRCSRKGSHLTMTGETRGFSQVAAGFSSYDRELREPVVLPQGNPISICVVRGSWGLLSSHCRANTPVLGLCPENPYCSPVATGILGGIHGSPRESGLVSSGSKEPRSPLDRDGYLLEPTGWPKGSQASCGVLREDSGLLSRPCEKRRASSHDHGGISWFFSSCGASVGFLTRYDGELREPVVLHQGSQVSI